MVRPAAERQSYARNAGYVHGVTYKSAVECFVEATCHM